MSADASEPELSHDEIRRYSRHLILSDVGVAAGLAAHRAQLFLEPVTRLPCARNGSDHYSWVAGRKVSVPHLLGCAELHGRGGKLR